MNSRRSSSVVVTFDGERYPPANADRYDLSSPPADPRLVPDGQVLELHFRGLAAFSGVVESSDNPMRTRVLIEARDLESGSTVCFRTDADGRFDVKLPSGPRYDIAVHGAERIENPPFVARGITLPSEDLVLRLNADAPD